MMQDLYRTDYHVHTERCGHAGGAARDYVLAALSCGLSEIAFTDHVPLYFLPGEDPDPALAMARSELPGYVEEVRALGEEFAGRIDVLLGLEADYAEGHETALQEILAAHDWDVVLGSVHWVKGDWIDAPGSGKRHEREGTEALWGEYYRLLGKAAATGLFDVLTHFDLPKKFGHRMPASLARAEAEAVAAARAAGVAIEVSSAGLRKAVKEEYPAPLLLKSLVAAGVPIVLSSDAHAPAEVAWGRAEIIAAARTAGAREHLSFRKRERRRHPL
ncbi:MAG: histidinol-phosphatase HisJ family protein [Thermoanaerobaculia bacterium]|nr:histidinol-phosphatase HisJ family protein [Thermoanaerobaculia bacterium]